MGTKAIRVTGLGKEYQIGERETGYTTFREAVVNTLAAPFRRLRQLSGTSRPTEKFWALKDVSFEVEPGDVVGIIGRNGAGKSTLLKILSQITEPTTGEVELHGRVASLLEVGTGFHPELTGRENIFLNGSILGMSRAEIKRKFDEIVAYAEVEKFLDTPVKRYSSGMYVRLAFAVAAHLDPEILIVDEVLAVGDAAFQKKCLGKMGEVARGGRAVLFVSHNLGAVNNLCSRCVVIDQGRLVVNADVSTALAKYYAVHEGELADNGGVRRWDSTAAPGNDQIRLRSICMQGPSGDSTTVVQPSDPIVVQITYEVLRPIRGHRFNLHLLTDEGERAFSGSDQSLHISAEGPGLYRSICTIPGKLLNVRDYVVELSCDIPGIALPIPRQRYFQFTVRGVGNQDSFVDGKWPGVVCPELKWIVEPLEAAPSLQEVTPG